ncbi:MAG: acid phosphatase [Nevskia sp.]|nr:acid phosphatase [Nevskia sp.]
MKKVVYAAPFFLGLAGALSACGTDSTSSTPDPVSQVQNVVFIYAENRAFDNTFGNFPGAHGLSDVLDNSGKPTSAYVPQKDRDGATVLTSLPPTWGGVTAAGAAQPISQAQSTGLPNAPFPVETGFTASSGVTLDSTSITRDLYHRFFENQMEINGGKNDMFAAWADAGGLTMGHFDTSKSKIYSLAQQYVLADNFFAAAYGGSFLNHQYLICACAPTAPASFVTGNKATINVLGSPVNGVPQLAQSSGTTPPSALSAPPSLKTGNIAPLDYFGTGDGYRAVNTMQPAFQPSGNLPADANGNDLLYADPSKATTLPALTNATIGDLLNAKNVNWAWYSGSWNAAVTDGTQNPTAARTVIYKTNSNGTSDSTNIDFQTHHQPFNYYAAFDPVAHQAARTAHLKDYNDLINDAKAGTLPPVAFYKPEGLNNQHEGYTNLASGDAYIANVVSALQASPQYKNMLIVITYDEFGGVWDHVAPPKGDLLGPGTRIPAIIISPLAAKHNGTVDHTQFDTASILRFIIRRWSLDATQLPGLAARDAALKANGSTAMGDFSDVLQ